MASTIQGYEGTGRSLSLKLIHQLRQQSSVNFDVNKCNFFSIFYYLFFSKFLF